MSTLTWIHKFCKSFEFDPTPSKKKGIFQKFEAFWTFVNNRQQTGAKWFTLCQKFSKIFFDMAWGVSNKKTNRESVPEEFVVRSNVLKSFKMINVCRFICTFKESIVLWNNTSLKKLYSNKKPTLIRCYAVLTHSFNLFVLISLKITHKILFIISLFAFHCFLRCYFWIFEAFRNTPRYKMQTTLARSKNYSLLE